MSLLRILFITTAILLSFSFTYGKGNRTFTPTPGADSAKALPDNFQAKVVDIQYLIRDAYEGSVYHSSFEKGAFDVLNAIHIKSQVSTIRRRILFRKGDWVTKDILLESERLLRNESFLADAILEVKHLQGQEVRVIINTFDQFSLALGGSLKKPAEEWLYTVGILESNFLGTGQQIGLFYTHDIERDVWLGQYSNKAFLQRNTRLGLEAGRSSDGYHLFYSLNRPLSSKRQKWGAGVSGKSQKRNYFYYLDADEPGALQYLLDENGKVRDVKLYTYPDIVDHNFTTSVTRSYGYDHKWDVSGVFFWQERYRDGSRNALLGSTFSETAFDMNSGVVPNDFQLEFRRDYMAGLKLSYYWKDYKTVRNFRRLKWNEDLDVGLRFDQTLYQNLKFLGAKNSDVFVKHKLSYVNIWNSSHFLTVNGASSYFVGIKGWNNGTVNSSVEYQWKPFLSSSTYFYGSWDHYFKQEKSLQLLLGGEEGLSGYPNRFFAGQARMFWQLEQRYFPRFEALTFVPVLATFVTAGNTFPSYQDFSWDELHYSAGIGLRVGATRTVQGIVNHINLSFPIDSKYREVLPQWKLTVIAKTSL